MLYLVREFCYAKNELKLNIILSLKPQATYD